MKKVMVFGTFDKLHPGHEHMLNEAKLLGDYLIIVVARDLTVKKVKNHNPHFPENTRLLHLQNLNIADKVILGNTDENKHKVIDDEKPDIIALGYDQIHFTDILQEKYGKNIKIVRLNPFKEDIYKSSKIIIE